MKCYISTDRRYKKPFGAVRQDQQVSIRILLPRSFGCTEPRLVLYKYGEEEQVSVPMDFLSLELDCDRYEAQFRVPDTGIYCYFFELPCPDGVRHIRKGRGGVGCYEFGAPDYQLTVYDKYYHTPCFMKGAVMYQVFPDRFRRSKPVPNCPFPDRVLRDDWGGTPHFRPDEHGEVRNNDYFCGDINGIAEKLPYLERLGVDVLYLNPVFEAHSNHRYNTADYRRIDPLLGTNEEFESLCVQALEHGIRIVLDGVFSHTGDDSVYFNRQGRYGDGGAYRDPESPYRGWYQFEEYPDRYHSWWGFKTLPEVDENNPSYTEFICGEDGVLHHWMQRGISGWRLDVADELPDTFLVNVRRRVKEENPEALLIGEVWEDASHKLSYGKLRPYLLGQQLDSVMNYPFKDAILDFVRTGCAEGLLQTVLSILENYPKPAVDCLMNSLSTHDTQRAITLLAGAPCRDQDREWQAAQRLDGLQYQNGVHLFQLASVLQFFLPGVPCIYYGDEAGMTGYKDPFNRGCYPWGQENRELIAFIAALGRTRKACPATAEGRFIPYYCENGVFSFLRKRSHEAVFVCVNRSAENLVLQLPENLRVLDAFGAYTDEDGVFVSRDGYAIVRCSVE